MIALDITCPQCGRAEPVEKAALGRYRCRECETEFTRADIDVPEGEP